MAPAYIEQIYGEDLPKPPDTNDMNISAQVKKHASKREEEKRKKAIATSNNVQSNSGLSFQSKLFCLHQIAKEHPTVILQI